MIEYPMVSAPEPDDVCELPPRGDMSNEIWPPPPTGLTLRFSVTDDAPRVAVIGTTVSIVTIPVAIMNVALVEPGSTDTVAGTETPTVASQGDRTPTTQYTPPPVRLTVVPPELAAAL